MHLDDRRKQKSQSAVLFMLKLFSIILHTLLTDKCCCLLLNPQLKALSFSHDSPLTGKGKFNLFCVISDDWGSDL